MFTTDLLWQNDDRWASEPLGYGPPTIKQWGCLMTSCCMVVNGYGHNETPSSFNKKIKQAGGFQGALIMPYIIPSVFPNMQFLGYDDCENSPAPISKIDAHLAKGNPVVVQVDYSPNAGVQSHWVVAYARDGDDYLIYDPYKYSGDAPGKQLKLLSRYHHSGKNLSQAISGAVYLTGTGATGGSSSAGTGTGAGATGSATADPSTTQQAPPKVAVPADSLPLYPTTDGLAMRTGPSVGNGLMMRLKETDVLKSLESKASTQSKAGQYNQWLHVQEPKGDQGYIAAWYVTLTEGGGEEDDDDDDNVAPTTSPAVGSRPPVGSTATTTTTTTKGQMVVTPITEGLAFRDQPAISGALIKRLPFTSKLKVLEPATIAAKKVGVVNQWLKVSDITGKIGYVAAWYVTEAAAPALGVKAETDDDEGGTPDKPEEIILRTTANGVALRRMPFVSASTLIRRLPLRAQIVLVDPADKKKVGVVNQWIRVKDVDGNQGYIAAWYASK